MPAAADDHDVVGRASARASGSAGAASAVRRSAPSEPPLELVGVRGWVTSRTASEPTADLAGTPAILPWASVRRRRREGPVGVRATRTASLRSRTAPTNPASGSTIASGSSTTTPVAPIPSASSGAIRRTSTSSPIQRGAVEGRGLGHDPQPAERLKRGHGALRVVERRRRHDGLAAVDLDAIGVRRPALPAEHQGLAEQRRGPAPRDVADDLARSDRPDRRALRRRRPVHREPEPAPLVVELRGPLQRRPADERTASPSATAQSIPSRRGVVSSSVSIPTITWPFSSRSPNSAWSPCGRIPRSAPGVHQRPPQLDRPVDRVVQLEGRLAGERQPHDVARHAGDLGADVARGTAAAPRGRAAASSSPASGPVTLIAARDIVRSITWTRRPHVSIQSRSHISALAAPPDVNVSANRVSASRRIIPSSITWPRSLSSSA